MEVGRHDIMPEVDSNVQADVCGFGEDNEECLEDGGGYCAMLSYNKSCCNKISPKSFNKNIYSPFSKEPTHSPSIACGPEFVSLIAKSDHLTRKAMAFFGTATTNPGQIWSGRCVVRGAILLRRLVVRNS